MDDVQFDAVAMQIARRGLLRTVLLAAGLGAAALPERAPAGPPDLCDKKPKDARCGKDNQCCSGRCTARKKRKGKGKRKGKCKCSQLQARCSSPTDCCLPEVPNLVDRQCGLRQGNIDRTCCLGQGGHCTEDADCCGNANCEPVNDHFECEPL